MSNKRTLLNKATARVRRGPKHMARKMWPVSRALRMKGQAPPTLTRIQKGLALMMQMQAAAQG